MSRATPIFLFGMERSGTTLLSMMLGAHPEIAVPLATTGMWYDFYTRLSHYNNLVNDNAIQLLIDDIAAHERIRLWRTALDSKRIRADARLGDFGSIMAAFHQEYARQHHKPYWGNIDIATLDNMHIANRWFPTARFVHIIRDGRDVALSNQTMPYGAGNIGECAEAWVRRIEMNLRMGDILGPKRYLAFRYEDLIMQPEVTLSRICAFLDLPFSAGMLAYGDTVDERVPREKQWLWPALKSPPQLSKVNRWQHEMTTNQRIVFERQAGPLLRELGYPVYEVIPRRPSVHWLELAYFLGRGGRLDRLLRKIGYRRRTALERAAARSDPQ